MSHSNDAYYRIYSKSQPKAKPAADGLDSYYRLNAADPGADYASLLSQLAAGRPIKSFGDLLGTTLVSAKQTAIES